MARKSTKAQFEEREDKKEFDPSEEKKNEETKDGKEGKTDFSSEKEEKEEKEEKKTKKVKKERKPRKPASANSPIHQVMPVVMLALCAFLGICIYTAIPVGVVGAAVHTAFFGVLGRAAYFAPVLVLLVALFWQRDVQNQVLGRKIAFGFVLLALTAILFYTFGVAEADKNAFSSFWKMGVDGVGGGVIGNCIGFGLHYCFAQTGTVIVTALLLAVFAVLFFRIRLTAVFHAIGSAFRQAAEKRAESKRRAAQARAQEEERKREQKERAEAEFYAKAAVSTPTVREDAGGKTTPAHELFTAGTTPEKKPVARKLFDAAAEEVVNRNPSEEVGGKREQAPATTPAPFHDDLFNDDPIDPALLVGDDDDTVGTAEKDLPVLPENLGAEQSNGKVTFVSDKPIPERPVRPIPLAPEPVSEPKPDATEIPASDSVSDEFNGVSGQNEGGSGEEKPHGMPVADPSAEKDTQEEEKIVINKAHTIEHIGADTFIDGDESYYKSGSADTFFYKFPPLSLLQEDTEVNQEDSDQEITEKAARLKKTLESYGVQAEIKCISRGPRLTRYELVPKEGVRIRAIESLVDEIAMNLEAVSVRIEAPIPGKAAIGVEVPNVKYSTVRLRGLLDTDKFRDAVGKTTVCLGVDVVGVPVFADLEKMPHLLVAGATGMGKSVCINSLLVSLLYKAKPDEVKLILIDPKKVEFKSYYNIPHLLVPVVTEPQMAAGALSWAVNEMERRYDIIERVGVRNIKAYNATLADHPEREHLPHIVIVIDELHDLMLQAKDAVEDSIARIAAKARAAGILLIIGTQRPSVNVITGVIKANIPSRIAFHVASQVDSRTIIDAAGAEKLLNNGDMLFLSPGMQMMTPKRVQGAFLDDDEVTRVAEYLRNNSSAVHYDETIMADMDRESEKYNKDKKPVDSDAFGDDEGVGNSEEALLYRAIEVALENGKISTSLLQRRLSLGFGKAARIIDRMQEMGIVSAPNGQKPRDILITEDEYRAMRLKNDD